MIYPIIFFDNNQIYPFSVECFRRFVLYEKGIHVPITCKKAKELLALLVLENKAYISKKHLAVMLWPDADEQHARDCLYKTLCWIKKRPTICKAFSLKIARELIYIDTSGIKREIDEFDNCYNMRDNPIFRQRALQLYKGKLLEQEYYDWSIDYQIFYEIRYEDLLK